MKFSLVAAVLLAVTACSSTQSVTECRIVKATVTEQHSTGYTVQEQHTANTVQIEDPSHSFLVYDPVWVVGFSDPVLSEAVCNHSIRALRRSPQQ